MTNHDVRTRLISPGDSSPRRVRDDLQTIATEHKTS
jgi:hypothetical protein